KFNDHFAGSDGHQPRSQRVHESLLLETGSTACFGLWNRHGSYSFSLMCGASSRYGMGDKRKRHFRRLPSEGHHILQEVLGGHCVLIRTSPHSPRSRTFTSRYEPWIKFWSATESGSRPGLSFT